MKVKNIEAFVLTDQLTKSFYFSQWEYCQRKICLVKITAEDGTTGWGEGFMSA